MIRTPADFAIVVIMSFAVLAPAAALFLYVVSTLQQ